MKNTAPVGASDAFQYTVSDGHGGSATSTITLQIPYPTLTITSAELSGSISERSLLTGSAAIDTISGQTITYNVPDSGNRPTASTDLAGQTVTWQGGGVDYTAALTDAQVAAFKSAFAITQSANATTGKVTWSYKIADAALDFLSANETVSVTTPILIDDHHGHVVQQNVVVTVNGANDAPALTTQNVLAPAHSQVPLRSLLVSFSDPDHGDSLRFELEDLSANEANRGGYLTKDGVAQSFNTAFSISADQLDNWSFVVGAEGITNKIKISAFDSLKASSGASTIRLSGTAASEHPSILVSYPTDSGSDLIVQGNLGTRADFKQDPGNDHVVDSKVQWSYDFHQSAGLPVHAVLGGTIVSIEDELPGTVSGFGFGNIVTVQSPDGAGGYFFTTYAHLQTNSATSLNLHLGSEIATGQTVGLSGDTGAAAAHIHVQFGRELVHTNLINGISTWQADVADGRDDQTVPAYFQQLAINYNDGNNKTEKTYTGTVGVDVFQANDNGDTVFGLGGDDRLTGGAENDVLNGGPGQDVLYGGAGNDTFVFYRGEANGDTVLDFNGNGSRLGDRLEFHGYGTADQGATFTQVDATHWQVNSADHLVHEVVKISNGAPVHSSDFVFLL
jgi:VCBS repeat-containing protein